MMTRAASTLAIFVTLAMGCKAKPAAPPERTAYDRDLERVCMMEEMSGALELEPANRALHSASWLATHLESQEGRDLSEKLTRLAPPERIAHLEGELKKAQFDDKSIKSCEVLYSWGKKG